MNSLAVPLLIAQHAESQLKSRAIVGLRNDLLSYEDLFAQIQETNSFLNLHGIGRNDPVGIVLPNGPLMATAFLSIVCSATCAPLNPTYTASEYKFYLDDLHAKAVVVEKGTDNPVIDVAQKLSIPIIELIQKKDRAEGLFIIDTSIQEGRPNDAGLAKSNDIALILHTSGTTSRPKMVPLTHKNLCISAGNIKKTLNLSENDCCLNIMPLFHIHGLMAAVLASVYAGGSIICTPGFYAPKFYEWLDRFKPTWYSAVPTMHQAILNRASDNITIIEGIPLRFIRSSSSSLAPNVMEEIESIFHVPVIEAYGMTEASHQMASNPLPPGIRKPGSVGLPAGSEVRIMSEDQPRMLSKNTLGEIVIRGDNVTLGYLNSDEANEKAFTNGWFRTGDQGYLDEDGYLFITGRLKEIINRGGEKISPREVDEVILSHPNILQVVTFAMPDEVLGEDIAAAVVLINDELSERDIKLFAARKLASYKVPARIIILQEIPKGPTGKLQRIGLAEKLGLGINDDLINQNTNKKSTFKEPTTNIERKICSVWEEILDIPQVGIDSQFRSFGGDSMLATLVHSSLEAIFGIEISLILLNEADTVAKQADLIESLLRK